MVGNICIVVTKCKSPQLILRAFLLRFLRCSWRQVKAIAEREYEDVRVAVEAYVFQMYATHTSVGQPQASIFFCQSVSRFLVLRYLVQN